MAKGNNGNRNRNRKNGRNTNTNNKSGNKLAGKPTAEPLPETPVAKLAKLEKQAEEHATDADLEAVVAAPAPPPGATPDDLIKRASELIALLESQRTRVEKAEADTTKRAAEVDQLAREVEEKRGLQEKQQQDLDRRDSDISKRQQELAKCEEEFREHEANQVRRTEAIIQRENDADAGFLRRNRESLAQLEVEGEALREQYSLHRKRMNDERAALERELQGQRDKFGGERAALERELRDQRVAFERELQQQRDQFTAEAQSQRDEDAQARAQARQAADEEFAARRNELENRHQQIEAEAKKLRSRARDLDLERELLTEDREAFDDKVSQQAARQLELKDGELKDLTERLDAARNDRDRFAQRLAEREEADRCFAGETPDEVLKRVRGLEAECERLKKALGGRPSAQAAQRLEELVRHKEQWESDRLQLVSQLGEARQEAARKRIAVTELESLRDEKKSLETANALLHEVSRQLRTEVEALVKGVEGKSPFPSCSAMDSNVDLRSTPATTDEIKLEEFAQDLRHRMARDPRTGKRLYYSEQDVRSFLGGLAMSRLHLLQGISGTGKTSLPLAFARAIGAGSALIEVQAGWRDRQDLIGHFNTFERRFYESEFLQAMYRASTPRFRDTPFIIVLDEMNLSHPEQYFADMLSALEQDQHRQRLVLMTAAVDPAPNLLKDGGTKLPIPPNVWFIGTANHDETTKDFADKTYDRAHVMELPRNRKTFEPKDSQPRNPVSLGALQTAFDAAVNAHKDKAKKAYQFLQDGLGDTLGRRFRVGWGNRLERQMGLYVPVVVAAGGTVSEATDQILATKLLRKIRDRHDNRPEDLIALRKDITTKWQSLRDTKTEPEPHRCLALLQQELHRLGHDDD